MMRLLEVKQVIRYFNTLALQDRDVGYDIIPAVETGGFTTFPFQGKILISAKAQP
jgi:hypothetical protein